jgi:hypothetical protein
MPVLRLVAIVTIGRERRARDLARRVAGIAGGGRMSTDQLELCLRPMIEPRLLPSVRRVTRRTIAPQAAIVGFSVAVAPRAIERNFLVCP